MKTLKELEATQYVLCKNHLLEGSEGEDVLQVVDDIIALHATSVATPYMSLFNRMKHFERKNLDREFYEKRNLIRLSAMRGTLFITSVCSAPILYQATKLSESQLNKWIRRWGIPREEHQTLTQRLNTILEQGGKTLTQIKRALPKRLVRHVFFKVGKGGYRGTNVNVVLNALVSKGVVISEKHADASRITQANRYMLLQRVYPELNLESISCEEAKAMLIKRYVQTFGPVTEDDIAWWTGFSRTETKKALEKMEKELFFVNVDGLNKEYLMTRRDYEQFVEFKPSEACSVSLLPYEDPYTKGYKVRKRLIEKEWEKTAYVGGGVEPTILQNGRIVGTWNHSIETGKGPIKLGFFQQVRKTVETEIVQKTLAIGKLMTHQEIKVEVEKRSEKLD